MAKLYFYYSAMNAGKSTSLLQSAYNYIEKGMKVDLYLPLIAEREVKSSISSRIGLNMKAKLFDSHFNFFNLFLKKRIDCIMIDESQFLTKSQVLQLAKVVDMLNIPVLCYGIRTNYYGDPFEGSAYLLGIADKLIEIKTICHCGKKATMNLRIDNNGKKITSGSPIDIGGNEKYTSCCRKHFYCAEEKEVFDEASLDINSITEGC